MKLYQDFTDNFGHLYLHEVKYAIVYELLSFLAQILLAPGHNVAESRTVVQPKLPLAARSHSLVLKLAKGNVSRRSDHARGALSGPWYVHYLCSCIGKCHYPDFETIVARVEGGQIALFNLLQPPSSVPSLALLFLPPSTFFFIFRILCSYCFWSS